MLFQQESRANAGETARCRYKFRYVSNFTTASCRAISPPQHGFLADFCLQTAVNHNQQESRTIAKMTARCVLYMDGLKNFHRPWLRPRLLFPTFLWSFVPIEPINVRTKFEVRSFAPF